MGSKSVVLPKNRVELHVHLEGAVRPQTVLDCARRRGINHVIEDLEEFCKGKDSFRYDHLNDFLKLFTLLESPVAGDEDSLRQIAYEFCEDVAKEGVLYCEVRYAPHLFANSMPNPEYATPGTLTPARVVEVINEGFNQGMQEFGIKIRSILCSMRHRPEWVEEILELCVKYRSAGVVGIDVAGFENMHPSCPAHQQHIKIFQEAKRLGINRTVHAGEVGPAAHVAEAVDEMKAQRIGHGYSTVNDDAVYRRILEQDIHLEMCPWSALCLNSVSESRLTSILSKLISDKANVSFNRDDPTVFKKTLTDDYELVKSLGLTDLNIAQANFDAARSAFLPGDEKRELIEELKKGYDKETLQHIRFKN